MLLFFSGQYYAEIDPYIHYRLFSYFYTPPDKRTGALHKDIQNSLDRGDTVFLDCGAYSAATRDATIDLNEYTEYCIKHKDTFFLKAALDVIGDADASYNNWRKQTSQGADVFPTFHYGEPIDFLHTLVKESEVVGLGGIALITKGPALYDWLDECWNEMVDEHGYPTRQVHAFGVTSLDVVKRYPWHCVDSTTWAFAGAMGRIVYIHEGKMVAVYVTDENPATEDMKAKHWVHLTTEEQGILHKLAKERGITIDDVRAHPVGRGIFNVETYKQFPDYCPDRIEYRQSFLF